MYKTKVPVSIVSDFTVFSSAGSSVLRGTYGIPGVLAEASLFTNPEEESRLKQKEHNYNEAFAFAVAIEDFFKGSMPLIQPKISSDFPTPFATLQEAERMSPIAKRWYQDYLDAKELMKSKNKENLQKAFDLFTQSAKSFPDSYVAGECHKYRAEILNKLGKIDEALQEEKRVREFYPN
jgi:tetratricopeptide (TPR) repeat protein